MNTGTYTVYERVPGQMYGAGQGIFQTTDGQGAIWNGGGVGRGAGNGAIAFAAAVVIQAGLGALERLNSMLVLVEHRMDMQGNAESTLHDWTA
jgi:hypothetical protein